MTIEWLLGWEVTSVAVVAFATIALGVLALADFKLAKLFFVLAAADAAGGIIMWGIHSRSPTWLVVLIVFVLVGGIGVLTVLSFRYVDSKEPIPTPSLVFVFGTPLGDNDSVSWMMTLPHFGPSPAYNCRIDFYDEDRINIQHLWRAAHPGSPFHPPELVGESRKQIYIVEASPEGSSGGFQWSPLYPDSQHYAVNIDCRDGVFTEKWEVTRVDGILRSRITIERGVQWKAKNPNRDPIVFRIEDPEFVSTPLAIEVPKTSQGKIVHPGWKPNHRFEIPVAILDPNGNLQLAQIKSPDGSPADFGSWNILTKHFGDNPKSKPQ
jgi:hypothetical protein